jgi:endonuclease YncB( thermonuclease family)
MNCARPVIIAPESPGTDTLKVPVLEVFDGDGFLTRLVDPQRNLEFDVVIGFGFTDAPEIEQPGGKEAKDFLVSLIRDQWIDLVILTKSDTGSIVDRFRRVVAIPYLTDFCGGDLMVWSRVDRRLSRLGIAGRVTRNIELEMILNGWTWVLERYGPDKEYSEALHDARRHRRGIWATDSNVAPWEFKRQQYRNRQRHRVSPQQDILFSTERATIACPVEGCVGRLMERNGRFGTFFGCSNFPVCRYTCSQLS